MEYNNLKPISLEKFDFIDSRKNIQILRVIGESASPRAIEWTEQNSYHWMSLPEIVTSTGYSGLTKVRDKIRNYSGERIYRPTLDVSFLFNTFFVTEPNQEINNTLELSNEDFFRPGEWFSAYICHKPELGDNTKRNSELFLEIKDPSKLNLINVSDYFCIEGLDGIVWTQKSIIGMDKDLGRKIFGTDYRRISRNNPQGCTSIFYGDFPRDFCLASPIALFQEHPFSFMVHPFYNRVRGNVPNINLFPVKKKEICIL